MRCTVRLRWGQTRVEKAVIAVTLSGALLVAGCGSQKKTKECNALITVINSGVEKVQKGTSASPDGGTPVSDLRALADDMDGIVAEAGKLQVTIAELKKFATDYQTMTTEIAASARELATAVDAVDMEKLSAGQTRMETAVSREAPLIDELNKFCQTP